MAKGDIIARLRLESGEFDSKIKRAGQELLAYSEHCRKTGTEMGYANRDAKEFAQQLGSMTTTASTARGKIGELSDAFVNLKVMYKNMTDEEKKGEFGRNLATSLDQLKARIDTAKKDLADVQRELNGGSNKFGEFGSVIDTIGSKLGVTGNLTTMLTSKTALLTGAVGAGIAIVTKATEAWASYNSELAKQDQITTVTTGLKGDDADRMTDKMRALSETYNVDFREAVNAANTLMTQFGKTGDEAIKLIKDGMQGMIFGDGSKLLSMIQQYAPSFRDAGVSASQLVAVIQNSEGGIFTDQNMNAIVMGIKNIRLMTKATSDALAQLGIDGQKMSQQLSDGSMTIFDALKQVATQIQGVNSNSQAAGEVMQQVFGRQGAMAGTKLGEAIATLNTNLEETKRQTGEVGDAYNDLYNANVKLNRAIRECFGYRGWEEMSTGIKTDLIQGLTVVLECADKIKKAFSATIDNTHTFLDVITDSAYNALGPLGNVLKMLRDIKREQTGNSGGTKSGGSSDLDKVFKYIQDGSSQKIRENRYNRQLADLNRKILKIGEERRVENADGSVSYEIDSPDVQQQKRQALLSRKTQLIMNRDRLLAGNMATPPATDTETVKPIVPPKTPPKPNGNKGNTPDTDDMTEIVGLIGNAQERVSDLQKRMRESWDGNEITRLRKELRDAQNDLDVLLGKLPKGSAVEMTITADTEEALQKVQEIDGVTVNPKTVAITADTEEALQKVQEIVAEVNGTVIGIKVVPEITDEDFARQIQEQYGKPVEVPVTPKTDFEQLQENIRIKLSEKNIDFDNNALKSLTEVMTTYGIQTGTVDMSAIDKQAEQLIESGMSAGEAYTKAVQDGIVNNLDLSAVQQQLAEGMDIPDDYWEGLVKKINEKLAELGIEPISIDLKTGNINSVTKDARNMSKEWQAAASAIQSVGMAMNTIEDPAVKVIGTVAQAIATVALAASQAMAAKDTTFSGWAWIGAAASITGAMISTIAAIHSATGYAQGGIVDGRGGGFVGGMAYSGDQIGNVRLDSGELVLNRAQQNNLAGQLTGNPMQNMHLTASISGEQIRLVLNSNGRRTGKGEYVQTNFR